VLEVVDRLGRLLTGLGRFFSLPSEVAARCGRGEICVECVVPLAVSSQRSPVACDPCAAVVRRDLRWNVSFFCVLRIHAAAAPCQKVCRGDLRS